MKVLKIVLVLLLPLCVRSSVSLGGNVILQEDRPFLLYWNNRQNRKQNARKFSFMKKSTTHEKKTHIQQIEK